MLRLEEVEKLKCEALEEYLYNLIKNLDELDQDDYICTEGWRHCIMGED